MSAIQIWLRIKGVMIPKKGQLRRLGLCLFVIFINKTPYSNSVHAFTSSRPQLIRSKNKYLQIASASCLKMKAQTESTKSIHNSCLGNKKWFYYLKPYHRIGKSTQQYCKLKSLPTHPPSY
ncbi:hypothetical protein GM173_07925 [Deefgea chitinilytica]|uniref:Uncharacterized protein n=1 Tax=Deefgea chitinilytica TaxID=570276 RepID=A0ABS2CDG2_9NEIS|nr:hypothetical protein [Deefgea chitinilytica]MBM9888741.1 hypothetical protein [Deefgea sp. CFH1-16]